MKRFVGAAVWVLALAGCDGSDSADARVDATTRDVPAQDVPAQDVPAQDVPAQDVPAQDVPAQDVTADVAPDDVPPRADGVDVTTDDAVVAADVAVVAADVADVAATDASVDVADVEVVNGCPTWRSPVARPGDAPGDDRYATYARGFFDRYCVRCHATTLRTPEARMGAPDGFNWDDETSIRSELMRIRAAVGVDNYMPITAPNPTCDERRRLVRWVDLGAP